MNKPPNAYILFIQENYNNIVQQHPELTFSERSTLLSQTWKSLDQNEKNRYYDKAYQLKETYKEYIKNIQNI